MFKKLINKLKPKAEPKPLTGKEKPRQLVYFRQGGRKCVGMFLGRMEDGTPQIMPLKIKRNFCKANECWNLPRHGSAWCQKCADEFHNPAKAV